MDSLYKVTSTFAGLMSAAETKILKPDNRDKAKSAAWKALSVGLAALDTVKPTPAPVIPPPPPVDPSVGWDFFDDFSDPTTFDTKWQREACQWGNGEAPFTTNPDLAYVKDGLGYVVARRRANGSFEGGLVTTVGKFEMTSGVVEVRCQVPTDPGSFAAAWLINVLNGTLHSEIDIVESVGSEVGFVQPASIHNWTSGTDVGLSWPYLAHRPIVEGVMHTYRMEWDDYSISVAIDGHPVACWNQDMWKQIHKDSPWVFGQKPLALVLDCTVGGSWAGTPTAGTRDEVQFVVDYIKAKHAV